MRIKMWRLFKVAQFIFQLLLVEGGEGFEFLGLSVGVGWARMGCLLLEEGAPSFCAWKRVVWRVRV